MTTEATIQKALAAVAQVAPDLAGRVAAFAITRTKRAPLRASEAAVLARGERIEIRHGRQCIAAWSWGSGPAVHLVHGWNGRAAQLGALVDPLVASGMRVVAHDSVGHGASTGRRNHLVGMADALVRVVEETGPARAIVAHSLGGLASAIALTRGLATARLTIIGAPSDGSRWPEEVFGLRGEAAAHARTHAEEVLGTSYARLAMSHLGPRLRPPVLVVHDRDDAVVPFTDALANVRAIADAGLLATKGLGHTRILRDKATLDEIVRFTASDLERRESRGLWQAA